MREQKVSPHPLVGKARREDVAKIECDALGQRLKVDNTDQLREAWLGLEELPLLEIQCKLPAELRHAKVDRRARPTQLALELTWCRPQQARMTKTGEQAFTAFNVQHQIETGLRRAHLLRGRLPTATPAQAGVGVIDHHRPNLPGCLLQ